MSVCARVLVVLLAPIAAGGCVVSSEGGFESLSGGTGGTGGGAGSGDGPGTADETGFPPDALECDFELGANPLGATACQIDEDCCAPPLAPVGLLGDAACPSDGFPNNWRCESGTCRQRTDPTEVEGCDPNASDPCVFEGFVCATISGVGHCVAPCLVDSDCAEQHNMPDSHCGGAGAYLFCMQNQP